MKYRWLIGVGIISFMITGCASVKPPSTISTPSQNERSQQQSKKQNNEPVSSESETIAPSPSPVEESNPTKITLPVELLIDGWQVGVAFSEIIDKLPVYSELDNSYMQYRFKANNLNLSFTWGGVLDYISTSEPGKGLNTNLNIGDAEQKIEKILGKPKTQSKTADWYLAYTYSYETYDIIVYVKDSTVQVIAMQLTGSPTANDAEKISNYYNSYLAAKNSKPSDDTKQNNQVQERKNSQQSKTKTFTKIELMKLFIEVDKASTLYQQTVYGSKGNSNEEKLIILEEAYKNNNFWDSGVELENAKKSIKKDDIPWYNFVVSYMDAMDSAYSFQIMAYTMIQSGKASEDEIKDAKILAKQKVARANQLYDLAKGILFP